MKHRFRPALTSSPRRWHLSKRDQRTARLMDGGAYSRIFNRFYMSTGRPGPDYFVREPGGTIRRSTLGEWAIWFSKYPQMRIVKRTVLICDREGCNHRVSTIFLGMDHSFSETSAAPVLWETWSSADDSIDRYSSESAAVEDHDRIMQLALTQPCRGTLETWKELGVETNHHR